MTFSNRIGITLEIKMINTLEEPRYNMVSFEVEPEFGMRLILLSKSKA